MTLLIKHPLPIPRNTRRTFRNFMMNQSRKIRMRKNFPQKMLKTNPLSILGSVEKALLMRGLCLSVPPAKSNWIRNRQRIIRARPMANPSLRRKRLFLLARSIPNDTGSRSSTPSAEKAQREITNAISKLL